MLAQFMNSIRSGSNKKYLIKFANWQIIRKETHEGAMVRVPSLPSLTPGWRAGGSVFLEVGGRRRRGRAPSHGASASEDTPADPTKSANIHITQARHFV